MAADVIRDLLVRFGVVVAPGTKKDLQTLDRKIEMVKGHMEDLASMALRVGVGVATFALGAATALGGLALATGQHSTEVERQARLLNLTRKEYQEWLFVTERFGGNARDLADSFLQINEASQRAIGGSKEMTATFAMLGISTDQLKGKNAGQLFDLLAVQIAKTADKGKAMAAVSRLLGEESARKLGPALMQGADAVKALRLEATELGVVMSDDQLRASKAVATQWARLTSVARGLRNELGAALAPIVERMLRGLVGWVRANRELISERITDWVARLDAAIGFLNASVRMIGGWDAVFMSVASGAGLLLLIANLDKILGTVQAIRVVLPLLRTAAMAAGAAIGAPFIPVAVAVAGLAGALFLLGLVVDDVVTHFQGGRSVLGGWLEIIDTAIPAFGVWRDMWWSVAMAVFQSVKNVAAFGVALVKGLAPALELVNLVLDPLVAGMRALLEMWLQLNAMAMRPMQWATSQLQSMTAASGNNAGVVAGQLQSSVAGSVQAQVDALQLRAAVERSSSSTLNQNNFFSGGTQLDWEGALDSANRKAAPAVTRGTR